MRFRTRDTQAPAGSAIWRYQTWNYGVPATPLNETVRFGSSLVKEQMHDSVNPGYFRAKREGDILPVSAMDKTKEVWLDEPGSGVFEQLQRWDWSRFIRYQPSGLFGAHFDASLVAPPWPSVDKAVMLQSALARAQTDAWDTATFMAEFGKTIDMLTTFYGRWKLFYERLLLATERKRGRFKAYSDAFASAWLEARYGFRPLYYDMLSIQEAYRRCVAGVETPLARGWETEEASPSTASSVTTSSFTGTYALSVDASGTDTVPVLAGGIEIGGGAMRTTHLHLISREVKARATVGVSVTTRAETMFDPAVTTWELVPFSFVMDWFITLGDAISAFSPFATGLFRYGTWSVEYVETTSVYSTVVLDGSTVRGSGTPSRLSKTVSTYNRVPASVTPTLGVNVNLNASKIIDLVALMWSLKLSHIKKLRHIW